MRKHPLAFCESCPLQDRPWVSSEIPEGHINVAFVGEAPAQEEVVQGQAFVGTSGRILWSALSQIDIHRGKGVAVLNACMCRGLDNKVTVDAVQACRPRLLDELKQAKPDLVVALGGTALASLTNDMKVKITKQRGNLGGLRNIDGLRVWATIHPASLLYQSGAFPDFARDLEAIPDMLTGANPQIVDIDSLPNRIITTVEELQDFILEVEALPLDAWVSADDETTGFNYNEDRLLCIAFSTDGESSIVIAEELMGETDLLLKLLTLPRLRWTYHNAKFDAQFERAKLGTDVQVQDDTMMMSYALDERRGTNGLDYLATEYELAPDYKKIAHQYLKKKSDSYDIVPRPELYKYAGLDAIFTRRLASSMWDQMDDSLRRFYNDVLMPGTKWFLDVELTGMVVDHDRIAMLDERLQREMAIVDKHLYELASEEFNPNSPQQVGHVMYDVLRLPVMAKFGRSTKEEVLQKYPRSEFCRELLEHRGLAKLYGTYVKGLDIRIWPDGRLHPQYLMHGSVSRTSCTNPNIQNIPRGPMIRSIFVAPPGYTFVTPDFSQHEFRMLAAYSGDPWLRDVFNSGMSLHKAIAIEKFGVAYTEEQYMRAKAYNFGIAYQRGEYSLAMEFGISIQQAHDEIEAFFERMPLARKWINECKRTVLENGEEESRLGRRRRFGLITRENQDDILKQAVNFPLQSTGSDTAVMAGAQFHNAKLFAPGEVIPVGFVHDAILYYVKDELVEEASRAMIEFLPKVPQAAMKTDVQFAVEVKVGTSWGEAH